MTRLFIAAAMFLSAFSGRAADVVPTDLTGVWATEKAVLRGALIYEGLAIYLGTDGVGAIVGGPPPIGFRIVFTYNSTTNIVDYKATENGKTVQTGRFTYEPMQNVIRFEKDVLRRRFDQLTDSTRKALGIEPTTK